MQLKKEQFLVGITTTMGSDWRAKIKEIDDLGLDGVAVFLTCLDKKQRQEFFSLLEETELKEIPFAHIKGQMETSELDYLIKKWKAKVFNLHSLKEFPIEHDYTKYKHLIYIENTGVALDENEIKEFAGICLDFAHIENDKLMFQDRYQKNLEALKKFPIGCNHVSAIKPTKHLSRYGKKMIYAKHSFEELYEFDYLTGYPQAYFSNYIAIELENSLKDQLKVIDYILKL